MLKCDWGSWGLFVWDMLYQRWEWMMWWWFDEKSKPFKKERVTLWSVFAKNLGWFFPEQKKSLFVRVRTQTGNLRRSCPSRKGWSTKYKHLFKTALEVHKIRTNTVFKFNIYPPVNKHSNEKSPSWIGNTSSNGGCSIAMLDNRRVDSNVNLPSFEFCHATFWWLHDPNSNLLRQIL